MPFFFFLMIGDGVFVSFVIEWLGLSPKSFLVVVVIIIIITKKKKAFSYSHSTRPANPSPYPLRLQLLPKDSFRYHPLHHPRPFPPSVSFFLPVTPPLLGLASVGVRFSLLPDRNGLVCQQGRVEATEFCVVAAVDEGRGGLVFSAPGR